MHICSSCIWCAKLRCHLVPFYDRSYVQFDWRWYLHAWESPFCVLSTLSLRSFPTAAIERVLELVWSTVKAAFITWTSWIHPPPPLPPLWPVVLAFWFLTDAKSLVWHEVLNTFFSGKCLWHQMQTVICMPHYLQVLARDVQQVWKWHPPSWEHCGCPEHSQGPQCLSGGSCATSGEGKN